LFDLNTLECGVQLFDRLQAESILLAGAHNEANPDQSADVLDFRNTANLFSLVNQIVLRQAQDESKMVVQCRGYAPDFGTGEWPDVLVAFQDGINNQASLTPLGRRLVDAMVTDGYRLGFVNGSSIAAGYEISSVPQAQYVDETRRKEFAVLWLSPTVRDVFRQQDDTYPLQVQLRALGIPITPDDLKARLKACLGAGSKTSIPAELKSVLDHYAATRDIVTLRRALAEWPQFEFSALLDRNSRQLLLLVSDRRSARPAVLNLRPRTTEPVPAVNDELERIELFLASRGAWLEQPL
jgi:gamma-polyglutamate biosynthesis protein CapC